MNRITINILFLFYALTGMAQEQIKDFGEFYKSEKMIRYEGVLSVYSQKDKLYLEIPEKLLGRELLLTAQVNRGAMMIGRPLPTIGVFYFTLGKQGKIYLRKGKYAERIEDKKNPLAKVLANSNEQPVNDVYDIVTVNPDNQGYVIDITRALKNKAGWVDVKLENLRTLDAAMELKQVEMKQDGVVFAFAEQCMYSYPLVAAGVKRRTGKISLEIGCMLRVLPERPLALKFAATCPGYDVLRFIEYGKNPYGISKDSVIQRWRIEIPQYELETYRKGKKVKPVEPIVFYIDAACPKIWQSWIKKAVLAWNTAFEQAGFKNALQVYMTEKSENTAQYRALISYDLSTPQLASEKTVHPETGEILSCRINIGHGILENPRRRYLLQCGAVDERIVNNFDDLEVAGEILCGIVTREIGHMLGLKYDAAGCLAYPADQIRSGQCPFTVSVMNKNTYNYMVQPGDQGRIKGLVAGVGEFDCQMVINGYGRVVHPISIRIDQKERKRTISGQEAAKSRLQEAECGIHNLNIMLRRLEQQTYSEERTEWLKHIRQSGKEIYYEYMSKLTECIGEGVGQEAITVLQRNLFVPEAEQSSCSVLWKSNEGDRLACCKDIINKLCSPLIGKQLLHNESGYTLNELYTDMRRLVFSDFGIQEDLSAFDVNLQSFYVKTLLKYAIEEQAVDCNDDYQNSLYLELQKLCEYFRRLAEERPDSINSRFYKIWQKKIEKQIFG